MPLIGVVHVPRETSQQLRNNTIHNFNVPAREVSEAAAQGDVLLGGIFNSKATTAPFNRQGRQPLQFCQDTNLVFSTGKVPGDTRMLLDELGEVPSCHIAGYIPLYDSAHKW